MSKPILVFPCVFCGVKIKLVEVQGQHVEELDRRSALGMRPHLCHPKRRSGYELRTGIDVVKR